VRRLFALALLALLALYLGAQGVDSCGTEDGGCPPDCHVSCGDGCALAPVPPLTPVLADQLPLRTETVRAPVLPPLDHPHPPEIGPPRA
jgi:hypothetical protein